MSSDIPAALAADLERLLDALVPQWVRRGRRAYLSATAHGPGSWQAELTGPNRGLWVRYSQGSDRPGRRFMGGGPLTLIAYVLSGETSSVVTREAFEWAETFLGWSDREPPSERAAAAARREADRRERQGRAIAERRRSGVARATRTWDGAASVSAGDAVANYLGSRGIDILAVPHREALRLHPSLPYWFTGDREPRVVHEGPAMIAAVTGQDNALSGVHVTWLCDGGCGKARIEVGGERQHARKMIGAPMGGHVRFGPAGRHLIVGEGIESTLSVLVALGGSAWSALSLANLRAAVPETVETLALAVDSDESDPALAARQKRIAVAAHSARGVSVHPLHPPSGMDWNDVVMADRLAAAQTVVPASVGGTR